MSRMKPLDWTNPEVPIEEYPGYVGVLIDNELFAEPELAVIEGFDWSGYEELLFEYGNPRSIELAGLAKTLRCDRDNCDLLSLLDQLSSLQVLRDDAEPEGPASAAIYVFAIADGFEVDQLRLETRALRAALDADMKELVELIGTGL